MATYQNEDGTAVTLTPEQEALYNAQTQGSVWEKEDGTRFNPLQEFSSDQLFSLATTDPDNFQLVPEFRRNKHLWSDQRVVDKIADAQDKIEVRGFELSDLPGAVEKAFPTAIEVGKGLGKNLWTLFKPALIPGGIGGAGAVAARMATGAESKSDLEAQKERLESVAGLETAIAGLSHLVTDKLPSKAVRIGEGILGVERTPEEKITNLWKEIGYLEASEETATGKGPFTTFLGGELVKETPPDPEEIATRAAGDPLTFGLFGKGFKYVHKAGAALLPKAVKTTVSATGAKIAAEAPAVIGRGLAGLGPVVDLGEKVGSFFAKGGGALIKAVVPGGVEGLLRGGGVGLLTGGLEGAVAGGLVAPAVRAVGKGLSAVKPVVGKGMVNVGEQMASEAPLVSSVAQLGIDLAQTVPGAITKTVEGTAIDIAFAAATSESPQETHGIGLGTIFGLAGGSSRVGSRVISGQLIAPRAWGVKGEVASSGKIPVLDAMHREAFDSAPVGVKERVNAIRLFLKGAAPGVDLFLTKDTESMKRALMDSGLSESQAIEWANQEGVFSKNLNGRKVAIVKNIDSAPHEAKHIIQDVLGESANRVVDDLIMEAYKDRWDAEGRSYASRLLGKNVGSAWRDVILDFTGEGHAAAMEKIALTAETNLREALGREPTFQEVKQEVEGAWRDSLDQVKATYPLFSEQRIAENAWRGILEAKEVKTVSDRYLARELAAENFDAAFKHLGPTLLEQQGLIPKLARIVVKMTQAFKEPLTGRFSDIGKLPLKFDVVEAVTGKARGLKPTIEPGKGAKPISRGGIPATSEERQKAADEARQNIEAASDKIPAGGTKSQKEVLGDVAEAIANQSGVKINYLSAPDEPAASITSNRNVRRELIELYRTMPPEARLLWEKNFFPERVLKTKSGLQVMGWAPEVFASNAHKLANALFERPELSPYPIDPKTKSFTPDGWKQLYEDTQVFVENQRGGRTGSGIELVVPREAAGAYKPPVTGRARTLDQRKSDFINLLFGFKLPETPRVQKGKLPLAIIGEEVSKTTLPGRVESPTRPRAPFEGKAAEELGIEGREIQEVNPVRAELERALGAKMPSFIEAIQKLNLENIKDIELTPEQPQFRGNTLTLTAGFAPRENPRAVREAAVRDEEGKVYTGSWHGEAMEKAEAARVGPRDADGMFIGEDGFVTNEGEFLDRVQALARALELNQITPDSESAQTRISGGMEANLFTTERKFQPSAKLPIEIEGPDGKKYKATFDGYWDLTSLGRGHVPAITALENMPGAFGKDSSGLATTLENTGYKLPELPSPPELPAVEKPVAGFQAAPEVKMDRDKIRGGLINQPVRSYKEAVSSEENPWVRGVGEELPDNSDRVLMVQISDTLLNPKSSTSANDPAMQYYEKLYSGKRSGYVKPPDFWEIPQWMGFASYIFPKSDVYVVRDVGQAKQFLNEAGYDRVLFSVLEVNKNIIKEIAEDYPGKIEVGGYVDPQEFSGLKNVKWHPDLQSIAKAAGVPYKPGADYRHFEGTESIPRLSLSEGCKYKCAFCDVVKKVTTIPDETIDQQVGEIAKLGTKLVYLNDKTFGQSPNYTQLPEIFQNLKNQNPDFQGFIIQTTASQLLKIPTDFFEKAGIKFVELGIETYNDPILRSINKPATEKQMTESMNAMRQQGVAVIPNIIIGLPGETAETYGRTLKFLKDNKDVISHANIYNLALYKDTELAKKVITISENDFNENILEKSFHTNPEVHKTFAGDLYGLASEMLEGKPEGTQFQPKENVDRIEDMESITEGTRTIRKGPFASRKEEEEAITEGRTIRKGPFASRKEEEEAITEGRTIRKGPFASRKEEDIEEVTQAQFSPPKKGKLSNAADEDFRVTHYSSVSGLTKVDPKFFGKGKATPVDLRGGQKSYFFVEGSEFGQDAAVFESAGLKAYEATVPGAKIYDLRQGKADPLEWRKTVNREEADDIVRDAGYDGLVLDTADGRQVVAMFKSLKVAEKGPKEEVIERALKSAAVKDPDTGEIYEGPLHPVIISNLARQGISPERLSTFIDGFVTTEGEFLDREQAFSRALNIKQVEAKKLRSDVKEFGRMETTAFQKARKFQAKENFSSDVFDEELRKIRVGESGGQTFTADGDIWAPDKKKPSDIITLASVNFPTGKLTRNEVLKALKPYEELLDEPGILAGLFSFSKEGKPTVSVDVNVAVPQKYRDNSTDFAKANDQVSIWDSVKMEDVKTGGKGNTRLNSVEEILDAYEELVRGKPVDVDSIIEQNREFEARPEQAEMFGEKEIISSAGLAGMTKAEIAQKFPEAVIPRRRNEKITSDITESPLYKQAESEDAAVSAFARRLVEFAKEWEGDPAFELGKEWYDKFTPMLKKEFGKDAQIVAELLAATSPQTNVETNFGYMVDALEGFKSGRFKKQIAKFNEGLDKVNDGSWKKWYDRQLKAGKIPSPPQNPTPEAFLGNWIETYDLKPKQSNGKLYGQHSSPVLQVFARKWLELNKGPKVSNFVKNLLGTGEEATIDLWADRTMRRVGYAGSKEKWRILPKNQGGVGDKDFFFAQKAFRKAAEELGIQPSALQGALWFAEKQLWANEGWGRLDLGDFRNEAKKLPLLRAGIKQRLTKSQAESKLKVMEEPELGLVEPRVKGSFAPASKETGIFGKSITDESAAGNVVARLLQQLNLGAEAGTLTDDRKRKYED